MENQRMCQTDKERILNKMAKEFLSDPLSSSKSVSSTTDDKNLLKFYQKKFEEFQRREDNYKERVDKHLKDLITDRHELEEEVLRRGEKISDLQKALVELQLSVFDERERFLKVSAENEELKRNEIKLHSNVRQLLNGTQEKDLKDKIIYILKDPKVEIGFRTEASSMSKSNVDLLVNRRLKEELDHLQKQLNEVLSISKSKSDIVLDDCKQALEKSKEKIIQDEVQIRELQRKIRRLEEEQVLYQEKEEIPRTSTPSIESLSVDTQLSKHRLDLISSSNIYSQLKDIHLSLILLLTIISKIISLLNNIQATKIYQKTVNIPLLPSSMQDYVEDWNVTQLEAHLRQCTRLSFDINNMYKSLNKYIASHKKDIKNINILKLEMNYFEDMLKEMTVNTTEADLLNVNLKRSDFFSVLRGLTSIFIDDKSVLIEDFKNIISIYNKLSSLVSNASDFVEKLVQKYGSKKNVGNSDIRHAFSTSAIDSSQKGISRRVPKTSKSDPTPVTAVQQAKSKSSEDLEHLLQIYRRTMQEAENLGFGSSETKLLSEKLKATQKKLEVEKKDFTSSKDDIRSALYHTEPEQCNSSDVIKKINKILSKVKLMENGEYYRDEELCKKLAENINALTKKFKEFTEEINLKSVEDQFSEYTKLTLSKLEELAKQCRNSVVAAEAQIAAHRSNAKQLSQKLKETEELLRESINECLTLKQKTKQIQDQAEIDKINFITNLKNKLENSYNHDELQHVINDLVTHVVDSSATPIIKSKVQGIDPFLCIACQQGVGHRQCEEKVKDLKAEDRKSRTQLKLLKQDMKEQKVKLEYYQDVAEKLTAELANKNESIKNTVKSLESKNLSLLDHLKMEKNRVKNMERFRRLEMEGFQTDIKNLKNKIRDLEKQLMKAVLIFENNNKDMELLKTVHETAARSKEATAAIRRLKAKLYELENDIKNL